MTNSTFVCVPGAWHTPEIYSSVIELLNAHTYPTVGLPLPSAGAMPPNVDFTEDVEAIRKCLTQLVVSEEKEVILVTHSYSGMPGAEAPIGLGKHEREKKGLQGGLTRLVFIMAYAMPEGFQPAAGRAKMPDWMKVDPENEFITVNSENAKRIFYHDIPSNEADKWIAKLTHQSLGVYSSSKTYAAWRYIPSTYVVGTNDRTFFSLDVVDMIINTAKQLQPSAFDVVEKCDGGHCLMISRPEWLASVLRRAAGEMC